ncbi:uncharacterized protein LOC112345649 isoform X2 [Selaginella moellendorffii]|uniref:uncharacterized protein LOC112343983 isoform X2 n=1 Tax=Selaginella moellendorffii TaxID=88036 RepID=UPI000D1C8501|nr:uncharacterized protein LOC112343983 isoform X2 [Selaginella moellendorffii]XP_024528623.1 uncharacterized protein LOC112345649 isoform X2 [Selaginella moellendorffii]|eukprot:XP_024523867.1 uncharacterized protein LOC112343983 isoform X2 [Selaginella moellendorffii]
MGLLQIAKSLLRDELSTRGKSTEIPGGYGHTSSALARPTASSALQQHSGSGIRIYRQSERTRKLLKAFDKFLNVAAASAGSHSKSYGVQKRKLGHHLAFIAQKVIGKSSCDSELPQTNGDPKLIKNGVVELWKPAPELYQTMDGHRLLHNSSGPLRHRERPREASRKMEHPGLRKRREYLMRGLDNNVGSLLECRCRKPRVELEVRSMSLVNYDRDTMLVTHLCDLLHWATHSKIQDGQLDALGGDAVRNLPELVITRKNIVRHCSSKNHG